MKAYIITTAQHGLGDQYTGILMAYDTFLLLESLGYDTYIDFWGHNMYYYTFNQHPNLDPIFNFSPFQNKILYGEEDRIRNECFRLPQEQYSIEIWVSEIVDELKTYEAKIYNFFNFRYNSKFVFPNWQTQFLSDEVLRIKDNFIKKHNVENFYWLQVRVSDADGQMFLPLEDLIQSDWFILVDKWIQKNLDNTIVISSSHLLLRDYFAEKYSNVLFNKFSSNIDRTLCLGPIQNESEMILHTQEMAAEMAMISHAKKLFRGGYQTSNYLTYGIMHNIHYNSFEEKYPNLGLPIGEFI